MAVTIQAMTIFVRAVEHGNFGAAARSLLLDPTAVSKAVGALEKDLDVPLFLRSTRNIKLTDQGAQFYGDCLHILQRHAEATQRFRKLSASPDGTITVGMAPGLRRRLLLQFLRHFAEQYPGISVVLVSIDDRAEIGDKGVDVLIRGRSLRQRGGSRQEPPAMIARKLFQSRYIVCASENYLRRFGVPRTPADLRRHSCIAHVSLEHDVADEWHFANSHERQRIKFFPKLRIQGADAVCEAGIAGCGIISLMAANIEEELQSKKLVPILRDWERIGITPMLALYRKTHPGLPQLVAFVQSLTQYFARYNLA